MRWGWKGLECIEGLKPKQRLATIANEELRTKQPITRSLSAPRILSHSLRPQRPDPRRRPHFHPRCVRLSSMPRPLHMYYLADLLFSVHLFVCVVEKRTCMVCWDSSCWNTMCILCYWNGRVPRLCHSRWLYAVLIKSVIRKTFKFLCHRIFHFTFLHVFDPIFIPQRNSRNWKKFQR